MQILNMLDPFNQFYKITTVYYKFRSLTASNKI